MFLDAAAVIAGVTIAKAQAAAFESDSQCTKRDAVMKIRAVISLPDSQMVSEARDLAQNSSELYLFNHVMRSWIFGALLAEKDGSKPDPELLAVSALLHDLGLTDTYMTNDNRFEVDGANAARSFLQTYGLSPIDVQLVWDAISLHSTRSIALHKGPVVSFCHSGVQVDVSGNRYDAIEPSLMEQILQAYPRLSFKENLTNCLCGIVRRKPTTTFDNFMHDFGERFVSGYQAVSSVDRLNDAPFES
ncbi:HD domain-containing protein [Acidisoma cellulosilytica]|uniref:HD domain-containing protein n=1 Tax=Acidisoma cellulosilyticum TaxID=2802395 RepID=A0A963Z7H4_9PROT|nr:HD domain-containing protein [Acidisoma cellulosilyticum]MCB8883931.1 HD domain-containing protein [Acidisoma cellulosilyticum]